MEFLIVSFLFPPMYGHLCPKEFETIVAERTTSLMALTVADRVRNPATVIGWTCRKILEKGKVPVGKK
ncbi:MAG: hypothetical protein QMD01_02895 [Thermodesulfovibrionales bacterium]|nr:hypothetical protein [Thermodesulfovibrionales bacterium]